MDSCMPEREDPFHLDRARLRASFDRASAGYEAAAGLQARIATELLERLELFRFAPGVGLDLAPGMLREARRHQWRWRRFERVCGDALRLPLRDASVDLVFSNLMLQWCEPLPTALAEVRRVLKPSGFFAFSTFGPDTLHELRSAWAQADGYNHVNRFADMHELGNLLLHTGLAEPVLDVDHIEVDYPDVLTLMRDLKAIGAHNVTAGRSRTLAGRARLARVQQAYESFRHGEHLPATYEVIYGASWGAAGRPAAAAMGGVAHIAPGSIRRSLRP